jgi:glycine cleavage system protein P-like pyridoxal-binding family
VLWRLERYFIRADSMDAVTLQPAAGAHGELCGMLVMRAYHQNNGQPERSVVIVPDSAHGLIRPARRWQDLGPGNKIQHKRQGGTSRRSGRR